MKHKGKHIRKLMGTFSKIHSYPAEKNSLPLTSEPDDVECLNEYSSLCPETVIVFTTFGRDEISKQSFQSLVFAISDFRNKVKVVVNDGSPEPDKSVFFRDAGADDVLWVPTSISAATQRNLSIELIRDKYSNEYICFLEDDYEYAREWYPAVLNTCKKYFGKISPWGMPYGMFSASNHKFQDNRIKFDSATGLLATFHGTVADQRFMPMYHYESVLRFWDPDLLGVSYCQTGMQTSRNAMRGFCGGVIESNQLCWEIPDQQSTWRGGKRDVGPQAHSMDPQEYNLIRVKSLQSKTYTK